MNFDPKNAINENMASSMQGLTNASKTMQAVTQEMISMSMESMRHTSEAFQQMQGARSWTDILKIQQDFFKSSFEQFAQRSRRIAELSTAAPMDLANRTKDAAVRVGEQSQAAVSKIAEQTQAVAHKTAEDAKAATVGLDG